MTSTYRTTDGGVYDPAGLPEYDRTMMSFYEKHLEVRPMGWSLGDQRPAAQRPDWNGGNEMATEWTYVDVDGAKLPLQVANLLLWLRLCEEETGKNCGGTDT